MRLVRLARVVGRETDGSTDCGFAQGAFIRRVHLDPGRSSRRPPRRANRHEAAMGERGRLSQLPVAEVGVRRLPLAGVRVLDLSNLLAGPMGTMYLADFGAEVIKVEHPERDELRHWGHSKDGVGLYFKVLNRNKKLITLNLVRRAAGARAPHRRGRGRRRRELPAGDDGTPARAGGTPSPSTRS